MCLVPLSNALCHPAVIPYAPNPKTVHYVMLLHSINLLLSLQLKITKKHPLLWIMYTNRTLFSQAAKLPVLPKNILIDTLLKKRAAYIANTNNGQNCNAHSSTLTMTKHERQETALREHVLTSPGEGPLQTAGRRSGAAGVLTGQEGAESCRFQQALLSEQWESAFSFFFSLY